MGEIKDEVRAFEQMQVTLEAKHKGRWALLHDQELVNLYASFEAAADDAVIRFGRGPFLIRQVGAPPPKLPASVMYHLPNAHG